MRLTTSEIKELGDERGITLQQGEGRPLFIEGRVRIKNGVDQIFMEVDTGSDRCIISRSEVNRLRVEKFMEEKGIQGRL